MRRTTRLVQLLLPLVFAAASPAPAAIGTQLPPPTEKWTRVDTSHFVVFGNGMESKTVRIARELEVFRASLAAVIPALSAESSRPTFVYAFDDHRSFDRYFADQGESQTRIGGLFVSHAHGDYAAIDADPAGDPYRLLHHEYAHYYVANNAPHAVPLWFNEGLAEYFSTFYFGAGEAVVGGLALGHVTWLREHEFLPLERLFSADENSLEYRDKDLARTFYAESWALVHSFILGHPSRKPQLVKFLELVDGGKPVVEAVGEAFGTTPEALLTELRDYVKSTESPAPLRIRVTDPKASEDVRTTSMTRVEVLYRLGDWLAHRGPEAYAGAEAHFREALALQPSHGPSLAGMAWLAQCREQNAEAARLYDEAIQADPADSRTYYLAGQNVLEMYWKKYGHRTTTGPLPEEVAKARGLLRRAVELEPGLVMAQAVLGSTFLYGDEDPSPGIAALERATAAMPSNEVLAFGLFTLYLEHGDRAPAERIEKNVLRAARDPDIRRAAHVLLLREDVKAFYALLEAGKRAEALDAVRGLIPRVDDPELKSQLEGVASKLGDSLRHERDAADYSNAQDAVRSGDRATARKLLARLAEDALDPGLKAEARRQLDRLDRAGSSAKPATRESTSRK